MKLLVILVVGLFAVFGTGNAQVCSSENCKGDDGCICFSIKSPLPVEETPQFVTITFDDAILETLFTTTIDPILNAYANPDGSTPTVSFYIPHKYTNYEVVNKLYNAGHDVGVHSITKTPIASYWINANVDTLVSEFQGQKKIISLFANVPEDDITGARIPQLMMSGNKNFEAYTASGIKFDNSWIERPKKNIFPYTLDFESLQDCLIGSCPNETYPGFIVNPIINFLGTNDAECNSLLGCETPDETEEIVQWLLDQFDRTYKDNRAPLTFMLSSAWFGNKENAMEAFLLFLEELNSKGDVYLASHTQVQKWMFNPVPLSDFSINLPQRDAQCNRVVCPLSLENVEIVYMTSCIPCPDVYPWIGNPEGKADPEE